MAKDAFYFPHDSNAKDDPKCVMLIDQLGLEGYGIYWILIETLRDQPNYHYPLCLLPALAKRFNTSTEKLRAVVTNYQLFQEDKDTFYSESLIRRMMVFDAKRVQNSYAGRISAQKRLLLNTGSTDVEHPFDTGSTSVQPLNQSKLNQIKEDYSKGNEIDGAKAPYLPSDFLINLPGLTIKTAIEIAEGKKETTGLVKKTVIAELTRMNIPFNGNGQKPEVENAAT